MQYADLVRSMRPALYLPLGSPNLTEHDLAHRRNAIRSNYCAQGPALAPGLDGPSSRTNSNGTRATVAANNGFIADAISVAAWVRRDFASGTDIVGNRGTTDGWQWRIDGTSIYLLIGNNSGVYGSLPITDRTHFLVSTIDAADRQEHWVDGVNGGGGTPAAVMNRTTNIGFTIGAYPSGAFPFRGAVFGFTFFRRVLTPGEIRRLYLAGVNRRPPQRRAA